MEPVASGSTRVGFIGLGVMGGPLVGHILSAGYEVNVFTRTKSKAATALAAGAVWHDMPGDVAAVSDVVFTMVGFPADVKAVLLGPEGVIARMPAGGISVDLTTSDPELAAEIAEAAAADGKFAIDAPVSGGDKGARLGALCVFVGGDQGAFERVKPLLDVFGSTVAYFGPAGKGQYAKCANQVVVASQMIGLAEGLVFASRAGLDLDLYISAISGGAAGGKTIDLYATRVLEGDFEPGFFVEHLVKDLGVALESCRKMKISLPGVALASQLYNSLAAHGGGRLGTQALVKTLCEMNDTTLQK